MEETESNKAVTEDAIPPPQSRRLLYIAMGCGLLALIVFINLVRVSKAPSYLSSDPKACINCHVMNTQYATWQHSSHARDTTCIDCHLPRDDFIGKYIAKARDGWNHTVAFTFDTYDHTIKISDDGARRVQANCVSCHEELVSSLGQYAGVHSFKDQEASTGKKCWNCHQGVPHGKVRGLTATPFNLGVKEGN